MPANYQRKKKSMPDKNISFLADECVFFNSIKLVRDMGFEVTTIAELGLSGIDDREVISKAQKVNAVLITNDKGFSDIYEYPPEDYKGIVVLKMKPHLEYVQQVNETFRFLLEEEREFRGKLFIVDNKKYRVRKQL